MSEADRTHVLSVIDEFRRDDKTRKTYTSLRLNMKVRDMIKMVEEDGWYLMAIRGSHCQYKHPTKPGRVTIAGAPHHDLAPGTLNSILKQAQLKENR